MLSSQDLKTIFAIGETAAVEFKRCGNGIENDVYETVCSFLNRFGGDIFLGVLDDGSVVGVPEASAPHLIRNFISTVSNPAMLSPTFYLSPEILQYDGRTIVHIHVPPSAEVHSFKRVIYDRTHDADVKVTATAQIAQMYIRKQEIFTEQKIYPYVELGDLRLDLLNELKIGVINNAQNHDHPWGRLSELEILKSTRLYGRDKLTGAAGFNLACVMLLGKDDVIGDIAPAYVTDALVRRINTDRYDDREIIQTNLVESYARLINFSVKHLPDPFFLEDGVAKSLRGIICRELLANTLIHREFTSSYRAKFVIEKNRMFVENANRAKQQAILSAEDFEPNPKNPIIANFFRLIGLADQLGSGVRNLFKYSRFYSGKAPEFVEGDVFRIIVPLDDTYSWDARTPENTPTMNMGGHSASQSTENTTQSTENTTQSTENTTQSAENTTQSTDESSEALTTNRLTEKVKRATEDPIPAGILTLIASNAKVSQSQMASQIGCKLDLIKYYVKYLVKNNVIKRTGSPRSGKWEICAPLD